MHAGITEEDILNSSSSIALGNFGFGKANFIKFMTYLHGAISGKTITKFSLNYSYLYRIIGLDPINPITLINRYVSFPIINVMNLYAYKYLS